MPNTPHSSWNLSSRHVTLKAPPPRVLEPAEIGVDDGGRAPPDPEPLAAGRSDPPPRDRRLGHQRLELERAHRIDRHDDARRPFAEQRQIRPPLGGHAALTHWVASRLASSRTPTTPMMGVGRIALPLVSL